MLGSLALDSEASGGSSVCWNLLRELFPLLRRSYFCGAAFLPVFSSPRAIADLEFLFFTFAMKWSCYEFSMGARTRRCDPPCWLQLGRLSKEIFGKNLKAGMVCERGNTGTNEIPPLETLLLCYILLQEQKVETKQCWNQTKVGHHQTRLTRRNSDLN